MTNHGTKATEFPDLIANFLSDDNLIKQRRFKSQPQYAKK